MGLSVLGPDAAVFIGKWDNWEQLPPWLRHIRINGTPGAVDLNQARKQYVAPMLHKGITQFPAPQTLDVWEHYNYRNNIYVIDYPQLFIITQNMGTVYMELA